jgi:hypothetical protein
MARPWQKLIDLAHRMPNSTNYSYKLERVRGGSYFGGDVREYFSEGGGGGKKADKKKFFMSLAVTCVRIILKRKIEISPKRRK